jgi:hypothetical protein
VSWQNQNGLKTCHRGLDDRFDEIRSRVARQTASRTAELVALYRTIESSRPVASRLFVDPLTPRSSAKSGA